MKKLDKNSYIYHRRRQRIKKNIEMREAGLRKLHNSQIRLLLAQDYFGEKIMCDRIKRRVQFKNYYYRKQKFDQRPILIQLPKQYGLESDEDLDTFCTTSMQFVDTHASKITLDMQNCERIWPSAITLLCSMARWVELVSINPSVLPRIASVMPNLASVSSYLQHCGFDKYVRIQKRTCANLHDPQKTVVIERETDNANAEFREDQISELMKRYSGFSSDDLEWFDSAILEIFLNVTEHGKQKSNVSGWWVLAQYHDTHKMISICIADNGIGIRNSLMTGPQRDEIMAKLPNEPDKEGNFIELAVTENVSGALNASLKKRKFMISGYESGSRRGNGLKRITSVCRKLGITLTIMSNSGYYRQYSSDNQPAIRGFKHRIFAGTLYHLLVKARDTQ